MLTDDQRAILENAADLLEEQHHAGAQVIRKLVRESRYELREIRGGVGVMRADGLVARFTKLEVAAKAKRGLDSGSIREGDLMWSFP